MDGLQVGQVVVVDVHADAEVEAGVASVNDLEVPELHKVGVFGISDSDHGVHFLNQLLFLVIIKLHVPLGQARLACPVLDEDEADHGDPRPDPSFWEAPVPRLLGGSEFGFGLVKLDVKTKSCSGVEFSTSGSSNTDTGKVTGTLETKYKWCEYGLTFTEKWNTDNTLGTEIAIEDQICQGLKLTFDTTFSPNTGKKSGKIKSSYKRECVNLGCDVDFDFAGPAIHGSAVFGYEGWLAGYQMTFDSAKSKLTRNNFAVGYRTGDFQLHTNVNDGTEFGGSIYQKVCEDLDTSVNLAWTSGTNCTRFGIAAKYQLDPTASISAKVNNSSLIGVGYTQTLRPGVKLTLSALVDGKSINAGGHKLGLALELEA